MQPMMLLNLPCMPCRQNDRAGPARPFALTVGAAKRGAPVLEELGPIRGDTRADGVEGLDRQAAGIGGRFLMTAAPRQSARPATRLVAPGRANRRRRSVAT